MRRCCFGELKQRVLVWVTPNHEMVTALRSLCHSTTQQLHQDAGYAGKTKPEVLLAKKVERKVAGSIPREDVAFSAFNLVIMIVMVQCAYSVLFVYLVIIVKWQLY